MDPKLATTNVSGDLRVKAIFLALIVATIFFALFHSDSSYSSDEVWSINAAQVSVAQGLEILKADVHPPVYFQLLHYWIPLVGTNERAVRLLSGLFYLLSVLALFGLAREIFGTRTALLACVLYVISPIAIISAQFARMYSLLSLLSVLSTWLYLQFSVKSRKSTLLLFLYVAINVLGTFTHVGFFFLLFGQIVFHVIFFFRSQLTRFALAIIISLLPYCILWAPILLNQVATSREGTAWVKRPGLSMLADLMLHYGGVFWLTIPILVFVWWRTGHKPIRSFTQLTSRSFPFWMLLFTVGTPLLLSIVKPVFNSRLAIVGLHLFSLTVAAFIGRAGNLALPGILLLLTAFAMFFNYPQATTCGNGPMAEYLRQNARNGDVVIYTSLTRMPIDYYLNRMSERPQLVETSFPAEIDQHPGYEGRINDPSRRAALEKEADELMAKLASLRATSGESPQVFFFRGRYPEIDEILTKRLLQHFQEIPEKGLKCHGDAIYFEEISRYK